MHFGVLERRRGLMVNVDLMKRLCKHIQLLVEKHTFVISFQTWDNLTNTIKLLRDRAVPRHCPT